MKKFTRLMAFMVPAAVALVVGCKVGPDYKRPHTDTPATFGRT